MHETTRQLTKASAVPSLARVEAAKRALAEAQTIDEVKDVRDKESET